MPTAAHERAFAVWLTGLPASGKSAIAKALLDELHRQGIDAALLESDALRTQLTPFPRYDEAERDEFYATMARWGADLVGRGTPVIFDATANKQAYRDAARRDIARFAEIFVDTPIAVCAARDPKGLYRKKSTITLPGLQAPYEAPPAPELVVHGDRGTPAQAASAIVELLERRGWLGTVLAASRGRS
jgi:adenylylsulfate kinase